MKIPRITRSLDLGEIHPGYAGIVLGICINPSRRTIRNLTSGEEKQFYAAIADILSIEAEEVENLFEEWPQELWNALLNFGDPKGLVWRWIDEHRAETVKNSSGGSSPASGPVESRHRSGKRSKKQGA